MEDNKKVKDYYKNIKDSFEEFNFNYDLDLKDFEGERSKDRLNNYRLNMISKSEELVKFIQQYQLFMISTIEE